MDVEGFEGWYRQEHAALVNSLFLFSGSLDQAREATDEAFARALARWPRVRAMEHPRAWTYRVAVNSLRRATGRRSRERSLLGSDPVVWPVEVPAPEVWSAVAALPERQRLAVLLRYVADLSEPQIANVMGISRGTVASTLSHARTALAVSVPQEARWS